MSLTEQPGIKKKSRVVVVTGASAGVGRAVVRAFAAEGARLALVARGKGGLEAAEKEVTELGGRAIVCPADVSDSEQVEEVARRAEEELGPIDVWVNNAMTSVFSPVKTMQASDYRRVMEVTFLGYVHGTLSALRRMLPRDRGTIVQVGSALAYRGIPLQSAYCAAKHAIQGFNDSLRSELIHDHSRVRVTMVQMPALNTTQFNWVRSRLPRKPQPVPPIFQPELAAEAVVHASRHYRREWYVGWSTFKAIVGNKMVPGIGDWYLAQGGYESQQYDGRVADDRPDNLDAPLDDDRDFGAHGDFDDRSSRTSWQWWATRHRVISAGVLACAGIVAAEWMRRRSK